jgi:formate dehydrogenase iron-sulfur subunit
MERAKKRVEALYEKGVKNAYIYGEKDILYDSSTGKGGLNVFYLLEDKPEIYGLPPSPKIPSKSVFKTSTLSILSAFLIGLAGIFSFRDKRIREVQKNEGIKR